VITSYSFKLLKVIMITAHVCMVKKDRSFSLVLYLWLEHIWMMKSYYWPHVICSILIYENYALFSCSSIF